MTTEVSARQALIAMFLRRVAWVTTTEEARIKAAMLSSGERYVLNVIDGKFAPDYMEAKMFVDEEYAQAIAAVAAEAGEHGITA